MLVALNSSITDPLSSCRHASPILTPRKPHRLLGEGDMSSITRIRLLVGRFYEYVQLICDVPICERKQPS